MPIDRPDATAPGYLERDFRGENINNEIGKLFFSVLDIVLSITIDY